MTKSTMVELVTELEKMSETPSRNQLINLAKAGQFHDYRSGQICGKMYFVEMCHGALPLLNGADRTLLLKMSTDLKDGEYDETYTSEDAAFLKNEIENDESMTEENKSFFKAAMGIV